MITKTATNCTIWIFILATSMLSIAGYFSSEASAKIYIKSGGLALQGYDTVAYFTLGKPAKGSDQFEVEYKGAIWRFGSAQNKDKFESAPEQYAPQYGGHCSWAAANLNKLVPADPRAWKIVSGKLYLNYNETVQRKWEADIPGFIELADANWPELQKLANEAKTSETGAKEKMAGNN